MKEDYWEKQRKAKKLSDLLKVGTKIKIGEQYANKYSRFKSGQIIELVEGEFEEDNGLYCYNVTVPSLATDDEYDPFDSIYHLFGNKMENWLDCEIV